MADKLMHDSRGKFAKGNPGGGRPRGIVSAAKAIAKVTNDGQDLIDYAVRVWKNEDTDGSPLSFTAKQRHEAFVWLSDRVWGKAPQEIKVSTGGTETTINLSHYTTEELEQLDRLHEAAQLRAKGVIDV